MTSSSPGHSAKADEEPILGLAAECDSLFKENLHRLEKSEIATKVLVDYQLKFKTWATFLGVFSAPNLCLDRRLQHHSGMRQLVLRLLDILERNLRYLFQEEPDPIQAHAIAPETPITKYISLENLEAISEAIERLNHAGIAIRESPRTSQVHKVKRFSDGFDSTSFEEIGYSFLASLYPDANVALLKQLAYSMKETYVNFKYKEHRQARFQPHQRRDLHLSSIDEEEEEEEEGEGEWETETEILTADGRSDVLSGELVDLDTRQTHFKSPTRSLSEAAPTSLNSQEAQRKFDRAFGSVKSRAKSVLVNQIEYPPPPKGGLLCAWCLKPLTKYDLEGDNWKRHINKDHKPFVCISERCSETPPRYESSTEWLEHMNSAHGQYWSREVYPPIAWICPFCQDKAKFSKQQDLTQHLMNCQSGILNTHQIEAIASQSTISTTRPKDTCPLCSFSLLESTTEIPRKRNSAKDTPKGNTEHLGGKKCLEKEKGGIQSEMQEEDTAEICTRVSESEIPMSSEPDTIGAHVASHLQGVMLLTLRLMALKTASRNTDDNKLISTDNDSSREVSEQTTLDDLGDMDDIPSTPGPDMNMSEELSITVPPLTDEVVDWQDVRLNDQVSSENDTILQTMMRSANFQQESKVVDKESVYPGNETYTVGWICSYSIERNAARAMLDNIHRENEIDTEHNFNFVLGNIASHSVVIAQRPRDRSHLLSLDVTLMRMKKMFPYINRVFSVGVGGASPGSVDMRLGDVIVGRKILWVEANKMNQNLDINIDFVEIVDLRKSLGISAHITNLPRRISDILAEMHERHPHMAEYSHPDAPDRLFRTEYVHSNKRGNCDECDEAEAMTHPSRESRDPEVHHGTIAAVDNIDNIIFHPRHPSLENFGILSFQQKEDMTSDKMLPCLRVQGISDYADSHKSEHWRAYAAATAAAYVRYLVSVMPNELTVSTSTISRRQKALASLYFDEIGQQGECIPDADPDTCVWIIDHPKYSQWLDFDRPSSTCLWIKGDPGSGKSTLLRFLELHCRKEARECANLAVYSFFFHAQGTELETSMNGMCRSLIFEILDTFPDIQWVLDEYIPDEEANDIVVEWNVPTLWALLQSIVQALRHRRLIIFIDAINECEDSQGHSYFRMLERFAENNAANIRVCLTTRYYPIIPSGGDLIISLENEHGHSHDLKKYILENLELGEVEDTQRVADEIVHGSSGLFLCAALMVHEVNYAHSSTGTFRKEIFQSIPFEMECLLMSVMADDNGNPEAFSLCCQLIVFSERHLQLEEFYFALLYGLQPASQMRKYDESQTTIEQKLLFILKSSRGLAAIDGSGAVLFIHDSVPDILLRINFWSRHKVHLRVK